MKSWMATSRVEPPTGVVSARFGGSYIFAGYSRLLRQWYWIIPGGEEKIAAPEMIFVDEQWAKEHPVLCKKQPQKLNKKPVQLALSF